MDALKRKLLTKFGVSRCGSLKMSVLCTDENISSAQKCATISPEALLDFFRRKALLVAGVRVDGNDDKWYFSCKPDGLCSLRASRMATIQELMKSDKLQSDVDINDTTQIEAFVSELRQPNLTQKSQGGNGKPPSFLKFSDDLNKCFFLKRILMSLLLTVGLMRLGRSA